MKITYLFFQIFVSHSLHDCNCQHFFARRGMCNPLSWLYIFLLFSKFLIICIIVAIEESSFKLNHYILSVLKKKLSLCIDMYQLEYS